MLLFMYKSIFLSSLIATSIQILVVWSFITKVNIIPLRSSFAANTFPVFRKLSINDHQRGKTTQYPASGVAHRVSMSSISSPKNESSGLAIGDSFTSLSFYHFFEPGKELVTTEIFKECGYSVNTLIEELSSRIKRVSPYIKGTLIIAAQEGVNGQFAVPHDLLEDFRDALVFPLNNSLSWLETVDLNIGGTRWYNFDEIEQPHREAILESAPGPVFPFRKLVIREKSTILTDGLLLLDEAATIDWTDAGPQLTAEDWHNELTNSCAGGNCRSIVLDCRNKYESDMGKFAVAVPLNTEKFSETWEALQTVLPADKNQRILTYCTGGIRCVKVNAYLKQVLGYNNVARLEKGIISYEQWAKGRKSEESNSNDMTTAADEEDIFIGRNFVFDRRRMQKGDDFDASS